MTIRHAIWRIDQHPQALAASALTTEHELEELIVADPTILSDQWMLIGRQLDTGYGGKLDLLAIALDGALVLIELKRNRTPREVVAQAIDYATYVAELDAERIARLYERFSNGGSLGDAFRARFGAELDEETLNESHQIVVVAAHIDDSTTRIIRYLSDRDIAINVLCFQVFGLGEDRLLSRAWLLDPTETQANAAATSPRRAKEPWNGETYAAFGHSASRSWNEAVRHGFISAGNGPWYSGTLKLLNPGDRVWVMLPKRGYVGVGRVKGPPVPAPEFTIDGRPALDVLTEGTYHREFVDDPERMEYFVPVDWLQTVPLEQAVWEVGFFANQNTVCLPTAPKWRHTIERLTLRFPRYQG